MRRSLRRIHSMNASTAAKLKQRLRPRTSPPEEGTPPSVRSWRPELSVSARPGGARQAWNNFVGS